MARYFMPQHQGVKKLQRLSLIGSIAFFLSAMILAMSYEPVMANFGDPCAKYTKGSKKWKKCKSVKSHRDFFKKDTVLSTDEERFMAGYWLAKNGLYREALDVLLKLKTNNDPRVLNYIGYATRKLGRIQEALVYYRQAISIAPDYVVSRAYMGEAFLAIDDRPAAYAQLQEIADRCGTSCEAFISLKAQIERIKDL